MSPLKRIDLSQEVCQLLVFDQLVWFVPFLIICKEIRGYASFYSSSAALKQGVKRELKRFADKVKSYDIDE